MQVCEGKEKKKGISCSKILVKNFFALPCEHVGPQILFIDDLWFIHVFYIRSLHLFTYYLMLHALQSNHHLEKKRPVHALMDQLGLQDPANTVSSVGAWSHGHHRHT